jgi:hypothetical protein
MHEGFGSGRNNDGLEGFSSLDFADILISESTRPKLEGCKPGSGRGWAWGLSAKLWHLATLEGEGDLDSDGERSPFSEIVSLLRLRDPPDIVLSLPSDGNLNFLCNVSIILSLPAFFLVSFDDDFPHHVGIFVLDKLRSHKQVSWKDSDNNSSKNLSFHISDQILKRHDPAIGDLQIPKAVTLEWDSNQILKVIAKNLQPRKMCTFNK